MPDTANTNENRLRELHKLARLIPREHLAREATLMIQKWPAYRFMPPMQATRLFHAEYVKAYKEHHKRTVDLHESEKIKIGEKLDMRRPNAHLTQLWVARQRADALGMPYSHYLRFEFGFAERRKRKHPPQPNQFGPNPRNEEAWSAKISEYWTDDMRRIELNRMAPRAQFAVENDRGLPAQWRFREELVALAQALPDFFEALISRYVVELRYLREEDCAPLGTGIVARALERARAETGPCAPVPHEHDPCAPGSLLQSCFGVPGIPDDEPVCRTCPHRALCGRTREYVLAETLKKTGSADPRDAARKRKIRERVARHRARKKAKDMGAEASGRAGVPRRQM
jgi:hypothetical protein